MRPLAIAVGVVAGAVALWAAASLAMPVLPISFARDSVTAVGPAYVDSFTVACGATATLIQSPLGQVSYQCQAPAAAEAGGNVLVAVGDSAIADPAIATRNSPVYSGDTVRAWEADARAEYCRADTGTVTIYCRANVTAVSPP